MYTQTSDKVIQPPADATPSRAVLQTRPDHQRALIRSWEYRRPVRITILAIRMLVTMWLFILTAILVSHGHTVGYVLVPAALAVFAFGMWVFRTAEKGWPVVKA